MSPDQLLYGRVTYGHAGGIGSRRTVDFGPVRASTVARLIQGVIDSSELKDAYAMTVELSPEPLAVSIESQVQAEADAAALDALRESERLGRNPRKGESWDEYVERTTRDNVWADRDTAMNVADQLIGPSPERIKFSSDPLAKQYLSYQVTKQTWDRLTPDEKRSLCRHMDDNWQGTRFWSGVHRFVE